MPRPFCRTAAILFFILLRSFGAHALEQPSYFRLGEEQFAGVQIYDVIQDKEFNYWFATDKGIFRYDYYTFTKTECFGMKGLSVFGFVLSPDGIIYCHNLNNQVFKIENNQCSIFYELKPGEHSPDISLSITPDSSLLILGKAALLFDKKGKRSLFTTMNRDYFGPPFLTGTGTTISHASGKDSVLLIKNGRFSMVHFRNSSGKILDVLNFFRIGNSCYAINSKNKDLYLFDEQNYVLEPLPAKSFFDPEQYLRFYNTSNRLWMASPISGIQVMEEPTVQTEAAVLYPQFLISNVYEDAEGNILLCTFNHGVLVIPNMKIPDVRIIPDGQSVVSIRYDAELGELMGTSSGRLLSFKNNSYSVLCDQGRRPLETIFNREGHPLVLFDDGFIKAYNKETGAINIVFDGSLKGAVMYDYNTFFMALNSGVMKISWDGRDGFSVRKVESMKLRCYGIEKEPDGKLLYVSTAEGLKILNENGEVQPLLFNGKEIFTNYMTTDENAVFASAKNDGILVLKNGKISGQIKPSVNGQPVEIYKLIVSKGKIYASTSTGFAVFEMDGTVHKQLNESFGFSASRVNDFCLDNNLLWVTHSNGVQVMNTSLLENRISIPAIRFAEITAENEPVSDLSVVRAFGSDYRKFLFKVASPTLKNRRNIRFHYKLNGYDKNWLTGNYNENEIVYNGLAAGDYTFMVKAENMGAFSKTITYSFSVSAPFYSRWYFSAGILLLLLAIVTLIYRQRLAIQQKKAKMENELNASRLTAIQSQMNPHFIFNSLNSIQDLVLKGDIDNSYTFITRFSNLIRRTLNYSDKDFIEFEQEIKLIELYLSLEKLRFKDELSYEIDTAGIEDIMIPPMLIQPFIENSLVHGLLHKEGNRQIRIRFEYGDLLTCVIEDNGIGREKAKEIKKRQRSDHESFSGQAIKKRFAILSRHFQGELGFRYEDLVQEGKASGTRVTLFIPVKHKY